MGERDDYEDVESRRTVPSLRVLAVIGLGIAVCAGIPLGYLLWFLWSWAGPIGPPD